MAVSLKSTIDIPIHTDLGALKDIEKSINRLTDQADSLKKAFGDDIFKGFSSSTMDASKNMDGFTKQMSSLSKSSKSIVKSFNASGDAADKYAHSIGQASDATKRALDNTDVFDRYKAAVSDNLDSVKKSMNGAGRAATNFADRTKSAVHDLGHLDDLDTASESYKKFGHQADDTADRIAAGSGRIRREIGGINRTNLHPSTAGVDHFNQSVQHATDVSEKFKSAGWSMLGVTAGLGSAFYNGAKNASTIQQQMTQITNLAVTSGEKRAHVLANVAKMTKENTDLSVKYGISQTDLAKGDEALVHAGYSTNAALAAHKTLVQGAVASGQNYNDVMNNVTNTLDQYMLRTNNVNLMQQRTKSVMNEMAYAVDHGKASFDDFGDSMRYVGATAHSTNQSLSGTMSAIAILSKNGEEGSEAGTGLRKVLNSFGAAGQGMGGKSQLGVMKQLGLTNADFHTASGHLKQLSDLMDLMKSKMEAKGLNQGQIFQDFHQFFGTTGQETALILEKNANAIKDMNTQVANAENMKGGGYVQWLAGKNMKTANNQLQMFKQAWNAFGIATANTVLPALTGLVRELDDMLLWLNHQNSTVKTIAGWGAIIVAGLSPAMFLLGGFKKAYDMLAGDEQKFASLFRSPLSDTSSNSLQRQTAANVKALSEQTKAQEQLNRAQADGNGQSYSSGDANGITNSGDLENIAGSAEGDASKATGFQRFMSRFHGKGATGTGFGRVADDAHLAEDAAQYGGKLSKFGRFAGTGLDMASKAGGALAVGSSLVGLLGMTKQNSGQKVGGAAGSIAGGAIGTLADPFTFGMGSIIGTMLGQEIGTKIGPAIGQAFKRNFTQEYSTDNTKKTIKVSAQMRLINRRQFDNEMMKEYGKNTATYKKYAADAKEATKELYAEQSHDANASYNKQTADAQKSFEKRQQALKWLLQHNYIDEKQYQERLKHFRESQAEQDKQATRQREAALKHSLTAQSAEYNKFYKGLDHMSVDETANVLRQNYKQHQKQVEDANDLYKVKTKAAKATEVQIISNLKTAGLADTAEGQKEIANAKNKYNKERNSANHLRDAEILAANKSANRVIEEAERSHKNIQKQIVATTGEMKNMGWDFSHGHWLLGIEAGAKGIGNWFKHAYDSSTKWIHSQNSQMNKAGGGKPLGNTYATGGAITRSQMALVGEQGPELAYNPKANAVRILGANGPQIQELNAGEHILNADQTEQVLSRGLGKGNVLDGYARGTNEHLHRGFAGIQVSLNLQSVRSATNATVAGVRKVEWLIAKGYRNSQLEIQRQMKELTKFNSDSWTSIDKDTDKLVTTQSNGLNKSYTDISKNLTNLISDMDKAMLKDIQNTSDNIVSTAKSMSASLIKITTNMVSSFASVLDALPKDASASMQSTVNALNQGISGIDNSLQQFGGNGSVLKPFHYAMGTNGGIPNDQIAMVNDANSPKYQEAIVRDGAVMFPKYRNQLVHLKRGDEVLNGHQTEKLIKNTTINHYAKGSGVSDSRLEEIAKTNAKHPAKWFGTDFTARATPEGPALEHGLTAAVNHGIRKVGNAWSNAMWSLIENTIGGAGGGSGSLGAFLKYAEKIGMGKPYQMGATGPDEYDCSGLVYTALKHFGITIGRNTVAEQASPNVHYLGKNINKAQVGDLAIFGHAGGADGHVGIISNVAKGLMMNATPPSGRISSIQAAIPYVPGGLAGYYHVAGLSAGSKHHGNSKGLNGLVSSELGKGAIKWISKHLGESDSGFGGGGDSPAPTGSHMHWLEQAGFNSSDFSKLNWLITKESGWNPHATNAGSGAYGIPQALPASKLASAGSDWKNNPITQLKWEKQYIHDRYGSVANAVAHEESYNWYGNGGWATKPSVFGEVKGQPEVAINPQRNSADHLIVEAINARMKHSGSFLGKYLKGKSLRDASHKFNAKLRALTQPVKAPSNTAPQITQNITINVNGSGLDEQQLGKIITEKFQAVARNTYSKLHMGENA